MSEHVGYIVEVKYLRKHNNADRLQVATFFGNDTIVGLDTKEGDIGIYFPVDLQLSEEYCTQNDLVRRKDENGNPAGGYLDPEKRNIKALKLRGEKSDGLFMPLTSLAYITVDHPHTPINVSDKIDVFCGHEICKKYIPKHQNRQGAPTDGNRARKRKVPIAPLFMEHADTEQLAYNLAAFRPGDQVEITLKMHGTSARTGYLPKYAGEKKTFWQKLFRKAGTPIYDWGYVTGTRRTVVNDFDSTGGFYGDNKFREGPAKFFEGKLNKGETVYYEIVGFTTSGAPIMASQGNKQVDKLLGDKSFSKQYGETTVFSYGCTPEGVGHPQNDFYVYRMTMTNEDGDVVEYTPDFMRYRCEQMGCKTVPVFWKGYIPDGNPDNNRIPDYAVDEESGEPYFTSITAGDYIKGIAEQFYDGPCPVGKTHVREGVVCRIVNRPKFCAYKHKNFAFKVLEGIIKETAAAPDMEEAEEEFVDG